MHIAGIANVAAYCCLFADAGQITITATGHLTVDGSLIMIYAGNVTTNGTLTVATDGTMKLGDDHGGSFNVGATGRLNLTGILIVASQGGFAIDPAGTFAIQPGATLDLDPAATLDFTVSLGPIPVPSDVRFGVPVGDGSGTCYVPTADYVALGTPIDATTGTAVLTEANVQAAIAQLAATPVVINQIANRGVLALVAGDDYLSAHGRALLFGIPAGSVDVSGVSTFAMEVCRLSGNLPDGDVLVTITGSLVDGPFTIAGQSFDQALQFQPSAAQTELLTNWRPNAYAYRVRAIWTEPTAKTVTVVLPTPASANW